MFEVIVMTPNGYHIYNVYSVLSDWDAISFVLSCFPFYVDAVSCYPFTLEHYYEIETLN